jgi:putative phosphoesterase
MLVAIISDIHGNLPALTKAVEISQKKFKVDKYICLGDVVGYGPWSNECVDIIKDLKNVTKILGNHEEYFINGDCLSKNPLTKLFFKHSFTDFKNFDEIKTYKKEVKFNKIKFTHTIENRYIFSDTEFSHSQNLVVGHSHQQFKKKNNKFWIINPGSLGQNRKNINQMDFAILDTESLEVKFISEIVDIKFLINEMKTKNYPTQCIQYYESKII